ncbi:hypothetical protein [Microtetraspora malaysiensis]
MSTVTDSSEWPRAPIEDRWPRAEKREGERKALSILLVLVLVLVLVWAS